MTLYRFHVRTDADLVPDAEGLELPDLSAALREALRSAREFRSEANAPCSMHFEIADPSGAIVLTVPIRDEVGAFAHH
jgi:hypothetical protein